MALLRIAFRNLLRARRRNGLAGGTMVLGSAALVLGGGLVDGIARQLTASLVAVQTGHVQVVARALDFQSQNNPFDAYSLEVVRNIEPLAERIENEGRSFGVVKAVPYLYGRGTAISGNRSSLSSVVGILPEKEAELLAAHPAEAGSFLPPGDDVSVYVAAPLAAKLRVAVGDTISFVVQTPQGAVNSMDATICGIFRRGAPWLNDAAYVSLRAAQALFDRAGGATNLKVTLADGSPSFARRIRSRIERIAGSPAGLPEGTRLRVEVFDEAGRFAFSIIQANRTALAILSAFLFLASATGIVNAMLMSVHERTREIGTLRALGMRRRMVVRLFVLEGFALGVVSAALGLTLGGGLVLYLGARGIPMNTVTLVWMAGGYRLVPGLEVANLLGSGLAIVALSTFAAIYPAFAASRLEPREALHHV
jgi:putative ABC transport system permease protein